MHRDSAADCFMLKPGEVTKALRNDVKGQFVFAEFYGSYYKQVARDLWETAAKHDLVTHLADKGVRTFEDFERHIEEAERIMWEDRFPVHNEWREKQWKFYQKNGYVELLTGFRCYGPMKKNNTFNSPVQGAGYHVLQWTMNQVNKKMMKLDRSKFIGEIHDSCVSDEHDSEADLIDYWYWDYGTQKVREHWDWIIVPLTVEKEQSEIDGSWADMKDAGTLKGDIE
jgi:DNA polymerase I-like protein with 3'-5' exonuclease and polymerase domains